MQDEQAKWEHLLLPGRNGDIRPAYFLDSCSFNTM